jgi:hypothetical protein
MHVSFFSRNFSRRNVVSFHKYLVSHPRKKSRNVYYTSSCKVSVITVRFKPNLELLKNIKFNTNSFSGSRGVKMRTDRHDEADMRIFASLTCQDSEEE